ncbi:MAG: molecular chaperone DjiA, partial [Flavobacteriaceae bacterium]|nr:molecular chaperone DjiA [Flavobacteriaceae bacterium]
MSFSKWIGGALGWTFGGPIGALLGFVFGSFIDGFSEEDLKEYAKTSKGKNTEAGDFEISLLVLAAVVIKADGKVNQKELDFVR